MEKRRAERTRAKRVVVHGLAYFCQQFPSMLRSDGWEISNYSRRDLAGLSEMAVSVGRCDLAHTWGGRITLGRFLWAVRAFGPRKLVMFWSGSDVLRATKEFQSGDMDPWIRENVHHWAGAPWLAEEVRAMGLDCEYVPATWVPRVERPVSLPKDFSVLAYLPSAQRQDLYGTDQVLDVAHSMPTTRFTIVGLKDGQISNAPSNVRFLPWVEEMEPLYRSATVLWRPAKHDGLSFMALEGLAYGRHVLWTYPFDGCIQVANAEEARRELERLREQHDARALQPNYAGMELAMNGFNADRIRAQILARWQQIIAPLEA